MTENPIKIGFISNRLTRRGSEINLYNYAHYNEKVLRNVSFILTRPFEHVSIHDPFDVTEDAYWKFEGRFGDRVKYFIDPSEVDEIASKNGIDLLFIEKAGRKDDGYVFKTKTIVHAIFTTAFPHGDLYAPISDFVNARFGTSFPVLPNLIDVYQTSEDLRDVLKIPKDAIVFGSYGGETDYNNPKVHNVVAKILCSENNKNIYFIYLNNTNFIVNRDESVNCDERRIKFLRGTTDPKIKRMFINTCDAMLYGRESGETFGLACGEFSVCGKYVICDEAADDRAHLEYLGDSKVTFKTEEDLYNILTSWRPPSCCNGGKLAPPINKNNKYNDFANAEKVMATFNYYLKILMTSQ